MNAILRLLLKQLIGCSHICRAMNLKIRVGSVIRLLIKRYKPQEEVNVEISLVLMILLSKGIPIETIIVDEAIHTTLPYLTEEMAVP